MAQLGDKLLNELLDLLGYTTQEINKGNINCPFPDHTDQTPSFKIDTKSNRYFCFGCKASGSLVDLYEKITQKQIRVDFEPINTKKDYLEVTEDSVLPKIDFVKIEAIRQSYLSLINKRKIKKEILDILNQQVCTEYGHHFYGYLCFEHDTDEDFLCGRLLLENLADQSKRTKYLFYKGSRPILGLYFLDKTKPYAILVEGIFDWFTLVQLGFKNVLCCFGTNVTKNELYKLIDRVKSVVIAFDRDFAGLDGSKTISKQLNEFGIKTLIASIPLDFGKDLNEALEKGMDAQIINFINGKLEMVNYNDDEDLDQVTWLEKHFDPNAPKLKCFGSGLNTLDNALGGGLKPGLVNIAGGTSQGKSAFAIFLAVNLALNNDYIKILYVTYEISMNQVWSRIASMSSTKYWSHIEEDKSCIDEQDRIELYKLGKKINVRSNLTLDQVIEFSKDYDVIFLDYMQVAPRSPLLNLTENEAQFLSAKYAEMSRYGQSSSKTFIALSSISKTDYKSKTASVKGSGGGDFSSYLTLVISREDNKDIGINYLNCYIQKNTRGDCHLTLMYECDFPHNRFTEVERKDLAD